MTALPPEALAISGSLLAFEPDRIEAAATELKRAAVCVPVGFCDGAVSIALIERAGNLRAHAGQWAFPGGRCDGDEGAVSAALREIGEELGIRVAPEAVLGRLDDFVTRSGYVIAPVVAWVGDMARFEVNPEEVRRAFAVPLAQILSDATVEWFSVEDSDRRALRLAIAGDHLYAPAAAIMFQLRELMLGRTTRVAEIEQPMFARR